MSEPNIHVHGLGVSVPAFEPQDDILNITVTAISQNKTFKLILNLFLNKIFISDYCYFSDIYVVTIIEDSAVRLRAG